MRNSLVGQSGLAGDGRVGVLAHHVPMVGEYTHPTGAHVGLGASLMLLALILLGGCAADKQTQSQVSAMSESFRQQQYDQTIQQANAFLEKNPGAAGSAEALYLRGEAYQVKAANSPAEATANLNAARGSFEQALTLSPNAKLEAWIRASLATVAYYQEDYATAVVQGMTAYPKLDDAELKGMTLYRAGVAQQRLGRFRDADQTFATVQQDFAGSEAARAAALHQGATAFYLQLATYKTPASADTALANLRKQGVNAQRAQNPQGLYVVRVGPMRSYGEAKALKQRFAGAFADAFIVP